MKSMLLRFAVGSLAVLTLQPAAAQVRHDDGIRTASTGQVTLSYRIVGPAKGRPLLLIAGTGSAGDLPAPSAVMMACQLGKPA